MHLTPIDRRLRTKISREPETSKSNGKTEQEAIFQSDYGFR
jgi:hypothetical protein